MKKTKKTGRPKKTTVKETVQERNQKFLDSCKIHITEQGKGIIIEFLTNTKQ